MPLTPDSGSAFCDPATFLNFHDARYVGQLVRADASRATYNELLTDPVLAQHLALASGEVESQALLSGRYTPQDLANLRGNSQAMLQWLVSTLAFESIYEFRGAPIPPEMMPQVERARRMIDQIGRGETIFSFSEVQKAGNPSERMRTELEKDDAMLLSRSTASRRFLGQYHPGR